MPVTATQVLAWVDRLQQLYAENRQKLTELDSAIGDADHGINMDRGFTAAKAALDSNPPAAIAALLQTVATTLIRTVGGASGPLYGTFFLRAASAAAGKTGLTVADVVTLFQAGVEGVRHRGKAAAGDKTMLDALLPAVEGMQVALSGGADIEQVLQAGLKAAEEGMRATIPMQARKGRASYLGPRSVGHQDPGATSAWLMLSAAADAWGDRAA